jgi:hypothetical protein
VPLGVGELDRSRFIAAQGVARMAWAIVQVALVLAVSRSSFWLRRPTVGRVDRAAPRLIAGADYLSLVQTTVLSWVIRLI